MLFASIFGFVLCIIIARTNEGGRLIHNDIKLNIYGYCQKVELHYIYGYFITCSGRWKFFYVYTTASLIIFRYVHTRIGKMH